MSEQLTATVIEDNNNQYTIKKGSYIPVRETKTLKDTRELPIKYGELVYGVNVDPESGKVLQDITVGVKTRAAGLMFGANEYCRQYTTTTNYGSGIIYIKYLNAQGEKLPYVPKDKKRSKAYNEPRIKKGTKNKGTKNKGTYNSTQKDKNIKGKLEYILTNINKNIKLVQVELVELLFLEAGKVGVGYLGFANILNELGIVKDTLANTRKKVQTTGVLLTNGIDYSGVRNNYNEWKIEITEKGEQRYEELLKKYVLENKQEQIVIKNKGKYEGWLETESVYSLYQRIIRFEELPKEDLLSIVPHHNLQKILNVATYYQLGLDDNRSFKEDYSKILAETDKNYVHGRLKENIEETKNICKQLVEQNNDDTENKKNVIVLTQMLGVIEELMA